MTDCTKNYRCCENNCRETNLDENLTSHDDIVMEQIIENINSTPIGQVLKRIASLPDVRKNKVLNLRQQINQGEYDLNGRLDNALERVLNELKT